MFARLHGSIPLRGLLGVSRHMQLAKIMVDLAHASKQAKENICLFGF